MRFVSKLFNQFKQQHMQQENSGPENPKEASSRVLSVELKQNLDAMKAEFRNSTDLLIREFSLGKEKSGEVDAALIFLDGLVNHTMINESIIRPLMHPGGSLSAEKASVFSSMDQIKDRLLAVGEVSTISTYDEIADACLAGNAVLLIEGSDKALDVGAKGWEKRSVTEPVSETTLKGPREGFTENLCTNVAMIRRKIKDPALKITSTVIGKRTNTRASILYVDGLANPELIQEVEYRLSTIDTDAILATGYVEQYIEDSPYTAFPTIWCSEKPDAVAGKLLEGRVAVAVDGAPFVMTVPMLFVENFQSAEDYITRSHYATMMRLLRLIAFMISLFAPALYIALTTYHQELLPTTLLFTMAAAGEGTPFPAAVEMGVMMIIFEILREAGVRMPRPVGQTISIVGALVMGEAAVKAGLVGAPVVIVIAMTAVSSFAIPFMADAIAILRWFLLIMAAIMGSFGITVGAFIILIHLISLRSFGAFYMAPLVPFQAADIKDTGVRVPMWAMRSRPRALDPLDKKRGASPEPGHWPRQQNNGREKP